MTMPMQTDYPYIRAWGRMMNSMSYYVKDQIEEARRDRAPLNSIYKDYQMGKWHTFDDVTNGVTRLQSREFSIR